MGRIEDLEDRLSRIEASLRGEHNVNEEPINLRALPLKHLEGYLEDQWLPEARSVVNPKSITADEIGELPAACVSIATDGANPTAQLIPNVLWAWCRFAQVEFDTAQMASLQFYPDAIAGYSTLVAKVPGKYMVSGGGIMHHGGGTEVHMELLRGRAGNASGTEDPVAHSGQVADAASAFALHATRIVHLYENDWVAMRVYQNSGVGRDFGGWDRSYEAFLAAHWIGA